MNSFSIYADKKYISLHNDEVYFIESRGDYVKVVTSERSYLILDSLKEMETKLNPEIFKRAHRSFIININHVTMKENDCVIINNKPIPLSRRRKHIFS